METEEAKVNGGEGEGERGGERMFTLKKWNAVAMWSWDVECDTCAICRVQVGLSIVWEIDPTNHRVVTKRIHF